MSRHAVLVSVIFLALSVFGQNSTLTPSGNSTDTVTSSFSTSSDLGTNTTSSVSTSTSTISDSNGSPSSSSSNMSTTESYTSTFSSSISASNTSTIENTTTSTSSSSGSSESGTSTTSTTSISTSSGSSGTTSASPIQTLILSLANSSINYCSPINITVNGSQTATIQWSVTPPIPGFPAGSNGIFLLLPPSFLVPGNLTFTAVDGLNNTGSLTITVPPMPGHIFYKDRPDSAKMVAWSSANLQISFSTCRHNISRPSWSATNDRGNPFPLYRNNNPFIAKFPEYSTPGVYHVMANITYKNGYVQSLSFRLEIVPTAPYAAISQNSIVLLGSNEDVVLDSYLSFNMDNQSPYGLTYLWACTTQQNDCSTVVNNTQLFSNSSDSIYIPAGSLSPGVYQFQLTVSTSFLSSSAYTSLTIVEDSIISVTISSPQGNPINSDGIVYFDSHLDPSDDASISWSSDSFMISAYGVQLASGSFYIPPYILSPCSNYSITCNVTAGDAYGCPLDGGKVSLRVVSGTYDVFRMPTSTENDIDTVFALSFSNYSSPEIPVDVQFYLKAADTTQLYLNDDPYQIFTTLYPTHASDSSLTIVAKVYRMDTFTQQTYTMKVYLQMDAANASDYQRSLFRVATLYNTPVVSPLAAYSVQNNYTYGIRYTLLSESNVPLNHQVVTDDDYTVFNYVIQPDGHGLSTKFLTGSLLNLLDGTNYPASFSLFDPVLRSASIILYGWSNNATDVWDRYSPYNTAAVNLYLTITAFLPQTVYLGGLCGAGAFTEREDNIEFYATSMADYSQAQLQTPSGAGIQFPEMATTQGCQTVNFVYWPFDIFTQTVPSTLTDSNQTGVITISNIFASSGQFKLTLYANNVDSNLTYVYCATRQLNEDWVALGYATYDNENYWNCLVDPPQGDTTDYTLFIATSQQVIQRNIQSLINDFEGLISTILNETNVDPLSYCSSLASITILHPETTVSYLSLCNASLLQLGYPISSSVGQILAQEYIHPGNGQIFDFISSLTSRLVQSNIQASLSTTWYSLLVSRQTSNQNNFGGYTIPDSLPESLGESLTIALSFLLYNPLSSQKPNNLDFVSSITGLSVYSSNGTKLSVQGSPDPIIINISNFSSSITQNGSLSCVYWNENHRAFDKDGCETSVYWGDNGALQVTCSCYHLTNFTVIQEPQNTTNTITEENNNQNNDNRHINPAAIVVPVVLGTILIVILVVIVIFIKRRRNEKRQFHDLEMEANPIGQGSESDYSPRL
ncbi:outer membrane protein, hemagluttinin-like protein [Planoprotostelium fungivorum]|uniref:Outer membrane protein, hemagluttinin-like protein n=1 Tax=Planoprotostelium fungivorum TaxID=1890364 RepID=A0A2P6NXH3_9EUKA|nr:outer membrane protein, hemagluttinin-like protein [Planoprotostelium fungivorum]